MTSLPVVLPDGFSSLVVPGDSVDAGQVLAQKVGNKEEVVNIPQQFKIPLAKVKHILKKSPGDTIHPGDVIAMKKNIFGKKKVALISEVTGVVVRYERTTGNLVVRTEEPGVATQVISPVAGTVELCNNKEIVIRTENAVSGGRMAAGTSGSGAIFVLEESFEQREPRSVLYYLDSRAIGKIVLGDIISREMLMKGVGIGVAGFLGISIKEQDLAYLQEKNVTIPVMELDTNSMNILLQLRDKEVQIDPKNKFVIFKAF